MAEGRTQRTKRGFLRRIPRQMGWRFVNPQGIRTTGDHFSSEIMSTDIAVKESYGPRALHYSRLPIRAPKLPS